MTGLVRFVGTSNCGLNGFVAAGTAVSGLMYFNPGSEVNACDSRPSIVRILLQGGVSSLKKENLFCVFSGVDPLAAITIFVSAAAIKINQMFFGV